MRELKYYVACSTDGFIARPDGGIDDFTAAGDHFSDLLRDFPETIPGHLREPLGVTGPNREFSTVLMGRSTYELGMQWNITNPYPHLEQYVVSASMKQNPDPEVQLVSSDPLDLVQNLKREDGLAIWLCGGSRLATTLFAEIDELILKVNPFLMGQGIPLFAAEVNRTSLTLVNRQLYDNGFMLLRMRPEK